MCFFTLIPWPNEDKTGWYLGMIQFGDIIDPQLKKNRTGGECCFGSSSSIIPPVFRTVLQHHSLLPHTFQPLHCLNILADRVECRLQTRRAIFLLFCPFLLDSPAHLTAKSSTSDTKLTLSWSISPKIVTTQINLGLNPRYLVGIYPPTLFFCDKS